MLILMVVTVTQVMAGGENNSAITRALDSNRSNLIKLVDLTDDAREYFTTKFDGANPAAVIADFNGDGINDVAMLTEDPMSKAVSLQLRLCTENECRIERIENLGVFFGIHFITPVKPGSVLKSLTSTKCPSGNCTIKMNNAGVKMHYYGKASITYYWDTRLNAFSDVPTSD